MGCAPLGNLYRALPEARAAALLAAAWDAGFRFFDTAPHYGQGLSERRLGDALRTRSDFVVSTKVGRLLRPAGYVRTREGFVSPMPFEAVYDYSYDGVMRSYEDSLQRLGLHRIDVLLMHDIGRRTHGARHEALFSVAMRDGYRALEELRANGDVGAIGIGANETEVCLAALDAGDWDCFLIAGRYTLLDQAALVALLPACTAHGVAVVIGGPYNSGILASGVGRNTAACYDYGPAPPEIVERVRRLEATCDAYRVPLKAAALQFPLAHPAVAAVIPGIDSVARLNETLRLMRMAIPAEFWTALRCRGLLAVDAPVPDGTNG